MPINFGNPWLLLGLAGVAVPILVHLLNRFRQRRLEWAAMELLRRAMVLRSRRIRIEDLLLLALRCLAVILIALAMSRPSLRSEAAKYVGAQDHVGAVIALDASYSMAYRPGVGSRFDRAAEIVRNLKGALHPGDGVSLLVMGNRPRTLLRNTAFDDRRLEKALADAAPLAEPLNLEPCLERLALLADEMKVPIRECYIVTDAQAITWGRLSEKARGALERIGSLARLFVLPTAPDSGENLAIRRLALAAGSLRRGTVARLTADVANLGRRPQTRVVVNLLAGEKVVDQHVVEQIEPGETVTVPLFVRFREAGSVRLSARIGQDGLETDNVRHAVARVRNRVSVLVVDGDPSDRPFSNETDFLMTALVPKAPAGGGATLVPESIPWMELPTRRLDNHDVVVLANVPDLRRAQVEGLGAFVRDGGGLLVFLGDKINPVLVNARMRHGEESLLPAEVVEAVASPPGGGPLAAVDADHALTRALRPLPPALMGETRLRRFFKVTPAAGARPILKIAGIEPEAPLLIEKTIGRGKVLLFTSTADRAWNNLPTHPVYPILIHEAVTYLTTRAHERPFVVGEPLVVPLARQSIQTSVTFAMPDGEELAIQVTEGEGRRVARCEQTDLPGFYRVLAGENREPVVLAVNPESRESDVKTLASRDLAKALSGLPVHVLGPGENVVEAIRESRIGRPLWQLLLIAALAVLALEGYLARRFSRRLAVGDSSPAFSTREEVTKRRAAG